MQDEPTMPVQRPGPGGDPTMPATSAGQGYGGGPGGGDDGGWDGEDDWEERDRRKLWMIVGGVLVAGLLIGALIALLASGGDGGKVATKRTTTTTTTSTTTTTTTTSTTTTTTTPPTTQGAPAPVVNSFFTNDTPSCPADSEITLMWTTANAQNVTISIDNPDGPYGTYGPNGSQTVPFACGGQDAATHTYYLTANGANGQNAHASPLVVASQPGP